MSTEKQQEYDKLLENLEAKMLEYETTLQTMTTIIICALAQNDNSMTIQKSIVEDIVNRDDLNKFEFEFKVHDNGDGELILIYPEDVEGMKKVAKLRKTVE
jgi:hypothetical protein